MGERICHILADGFQEKGKHSLTNIYSMLSPCRLRLYQPVWSARQEITMKLKVLVACSIVVSLFGGVARGQATPSAWNGAISPQPGMQAWQRDSRDREFAPPAPRGDLRGDIESNARTRFDPQAREGERAWRR
jgi:hypothetical protein